MGFELDDNERECLGKCLQGHMDIIMQQELVLSHSYSYGALGIPDANL